MTIIDTIIETIKERFFTHHKPLEPGVYHYQSPPESDFPYRLHLRLDQNGSAILILNASTVLHLNQTAAEFAYYLVNQTPLAEIIRTISRRYRIQHEQVLQDYHDFQDSIHSLVNKPDLDPVTFLGFDRLTPYSEIINAPYRLDCALTYQEVDQGLGASAPRDRVSRDLTTEEWKIIFDKAWKAGIPHLIFTGGEPTIRPDLPDLIAHAEKLGQVTGLLTGGYRLGEPEYLEQLLQCGLDHAMIVLDPNDETAWEAIRDVLAQDIFLTVHLTIRDEEPEFYLGLVKRLAQMELKSLSLSAAQPSLQNILDQVRQEAEYLDISLVWDIPVPYSAINPVKIELENANEYIPGEGRAWLYVEPDGDVLARQGKPQSLGNLLTDPWEQIWEKALEASKENDG